MELDRFLSGLSKKESLVVIICIVNLLSEHLKVKNTFLATFKTRVVHLMMSTLNRKSNKFKARETKRDEKRRTKKKSRLGSNGNEHKSFKNRLMFIVIYYESEIFMIINCR